MTRSKGGGQGLLSGFLGNEPRHPVHLLILRLIFIIVNGLLLCQGFRKAGGSDLSNYKSTKGKFALSINKHKGAVLFNLSSVYFIYLCIHSSLSYVCIFFIGEGGGGS